MKLKGKNILVGITGSIAAYKAATLIRLLVKEGAEVKVVMTELGKEFITPLTLATLSKNPILVDFFDPENGQWNSHVDLGMWADLYLIAPATANTMGKMAHGIADNLLITSYMSAKCPVMIAPAMDLDMFQHPANLKNIEILKSYGNIIVEPASGELASGLTGKGRMEEPEKITEKVIEFFHQKKKLSAKKILITAGPTYESIDPVRFVGNYSSGKMGYALAKAFAHEGGEVVLISGPTSQSVDHPLIKQVNVNSADEMYDEVIKFFPQMDVAVMAAAVSDYRPAQKSEKKIKRKGDNLTIELIPNKDIAAAVGQMKKKQITIGFALETDNELENAKKKIHTKNLDFIVLNSLKEEGAGFGVDTNKITIIRKDGTSQHYELKTKDEVAADILDVTIEMMR